MDHEVLEWQKAELKFGFIEKWNGANSLMDFLIRKKLAVCTLILTKFLENC